MNVESTVLFKKIYGCLTGGLVGDAMGGPSEGMHYKEIKAKFGEITRLMDYRGKPTGYATDDSALKHMLCKAIIRRGGRPSCEDWAEVWWEDMDLRIFIAPVINSFNKIFLMGVPPREAGHGNQLSNSSSMCISPIGIINPCDPRQAALDAYCLSQMIHSGFPQDGASAVAAATAAAFNPEAGVDSIVEAALTYLPKNSEVLIGIDYAMGLARESRDYITFRERFYEGIEAEPGDPVVDPRPIFLPSYERLNERLKSKRYFIADPRESIPVALAIFWLDRGDPVKTIIDCANFARDSDTIGTIAGAIAGAFKGIDAFPSEWIKTVQKVNQPDQVELSKHLFNIVVKIVRETEERVQILKRLV